MNAQTAQALKDLIDLQDAADAPLAITNLKAGEPVEVRRELNKAIGHLGCGQTTQAKVHIDCALAHAVGDPTPADLAAEYDPAEDADSEVELGEPEEATA